MKKPLLFIGKTAREMDTSAKTAEIILAFSEERRKLGVDKFLTRHIEIIAQIFKISEQQIKRDLDFKTLVGKYLDCLEYVARELGKVGE